MVPALVEQEVIGDPRRPGAAAMLQGFANGQLTRPPLSPMRHVHHCSLGFSSFSANLRFAHATLAQIMVTLLAALEKYDLKRGVASLCIGGGEATAIALERMR